MATETKKKYTYLTKAVQMPDGTRKYFRAKTQEELDEKVLKARILVNAGVDICSEETFGHFANLINLRSIFSTAQGNGLAAKSPVSNMLKPGGRKTPEKEGRSGEQSASGAGQEYPGEDVPADGPLHGGEARGDRGAPVGGHRLRGHSHPAQRRDRPL